MLHLKGQRLVLAVGIVVVLVGVAAAAWYLRRPPAATSAQRGCRLAGELGCFACHGAGGVGGIADPGSVGGRVPGWEHGAAILYARNAADVRAWIADGRLDRDHRALGAGVADAEARLGRVGMAAYRDVLDDAALDDLVACVMAVSGLADDMPDAAWDGRKVADQLGCFGCHGPSGMGGMANPGSLKGVIPAWDGDEFVDLVRDDDELREWILEGRLERLWTNPAARVFLQRQKTQMPAYRDHLSASQLDALVTYIRWLRAP